MGFALVRRWEAVGEGVAEGFRGVGADAADAGSEVEAKVGSEAGNGAGVAGRGRGCLEKGAGSREGDVEERGVETGVGARSGGGGVGRGRVS